MTIKQALNYAISVPKTIYFNFMCFEFRKAVHLPVFVAWNVKCRKLKKGSIEIPENAQTFSIQIGFNGVEAIESGKSIFNLDSGTIIFRGNCAIASGCRIGVSNNGIIDFGDGFSANKNFFISCNKHIIFGKDAMFGWNVSFFDANGHPVYVNGEIKENTRKIEVGDHVWIGSECHVLKGTVIPCNSIIAYGSVVTTKLYEPNCVYGGNPVKKIQENINWKRHWE
jgi:acetyltransferase-like isoleucine patch superfamily enzyme